MSIFGRLKLAVISLYKTSVDKDTKRFYNLASFLNINLGKTKKQEGTTEPLSVDAALSGKVKNDMRDWFMEILEDYLPVGYFDEENRKEHPDRERMFDELILRIYSGLGMTIRQGIGRKLNSLGYRKDMFDWENLGLTDEVIEDQILKMIMYYKENPLQIKNAIIKLKGFGGKNKSDPDTFKELKELEDNKKKQEEYKPGPAELEFVPIVSEQLYNKYKKYFEEHSTDFPKTLAYVKEKKNRSYLVPEDFGITLGKSDPNITKILGDLKTFHVDIKNYGETYDPRQKNSVEEISFTIPELEKENKEFYGDTPFTIKLPVDFPHMRPIEPIEVSVTHERKLKADKAFSLFLRFEDQYKTLTGHLVDEFKETGFVDNSDFKSFMMRLINTYVSNEIIKQRSLDEMISDLGGKVQVRGVVNPETGEPASFGSVMDVKDILEAGGEPLTREQLRKTKEETTVKKYHEKAMQLFKEKVDAAVDAGGEKLRGFLFRITPEEGGAMKKTIINSRLFPKLQDLVDRIKSGEDKKTGLEGILKTKEVVSFMADVLFDSEKFLSDPQALITHTRDFIRSDEILKEPVFTDAIRLLLFRQDLQDKGLKGEALATSLQAADWTTLRSQYDVQKIKSFLNDPKKSAMSGTISYAISGIVSKIAEVIKESPIFERFHDRIRVWKAYENKVVQREVDDILSGDKPLPKGIDVEDDLKAKFVTEKEEKDPRTEEPIKTRSGKPVVRGYVDPEKMKSSGVTQGDIDTLAKATYNYFATQLLQKAYSPEEVSYLNLVKCAKEKIRI
jgi:hypothetical protein